MNLITRYQPFSDAERLSVERNGITYAFWFADDQELLAQLAECGFDEDEKQEVLSDLQTGRRQNYALAEEEWEDEYQGGYQGGYHEHHYLRQRIDWTQACLFALAIIVAVAIAGGK